MLSQSTTSTAADLHTPPTRSRHRHVTNLQWSSPSAITIHTAVHHYLVLLFPQGYLTPFLWDALQSWYQNLHQIRLIIFQIHAEGESGAQPNTIWF